MQMRLLAPASGIAFLLVAADAWGQAEAFGVHVRRWRTSIDGDFRADSGGITGTDYDLRATGDMSETEDLNDVGVTFNFPGLGKLNLQAWQGTYKGETTLTQDVTLGGATFT